MTQQKEIAIPPIPEGYEYIYGERNKGLVIERMSDGSQFVWVPVEKLYEYKRGFKSDTINKYGGFYISRFNISKSENGKPQSIQGMEPWTNVAYDYIVKIAKSMEDSKDVKSHLTYDAEYNLVLDWLINSKAVTFDDIYTDSSNIGNYKSFDNESDKPAKTGSCEEWCINNIYDFAGNVREWTMVDDNFAARRGGAYTDYGHVNTANFSYISSPHTGFGVVVGFRIVLDIK